MLLYLIRHGETEWNKEKRFQGQANTHLAEKGISLAKETGEGMKDIPIDYVISSPLNRAVQTAKLITAGRDLPIMTDRRIAEISFGAWEGLSSQKGGGIPDDYLDLFYTTPMLCDRPPNGETFQDVRERTKDFYQSLLAEPKYENASILISSHGAASRCLLSHFTDDPDDIWQGCVPPNCSVTIIEVKNGGKETRILEKDRIFYKE